MKVGFFQFEPKFGQKKRNIQRINEISADIEADLLVLPELFSSGYTFVSMEEVASCAEEIPGYTTTKLQEISEQKNMYIVAGMAEKKAKKYYNSSVLVCPDGKLKIYRKAHLFSEEKKFFSLGNTPFRVHRIKETAIGLLICFDWIFPEATRTLALKGAEIICQPSNLILPYCQQVMLARAIENRVFIITANRIGQERKYTFTGRSQIVNPKGKILIKANENEEKLGIVNIDPSKARNKWINEYNHIFKDRRPNLYKLD